MARFGKIPVIIPEGVEVEASLGKLIVKGVKGTVEKKFPDAISFKKQGNEILVERKNDVKQTLSLQGSFRSHLVNMVEGVINGWRKQLEIQGAGYRATVQGQDLVLAIGYSHPVVIKAPEGVTFSVEKEIITVDGYDKEAVTLTAARVKAVRPPDAYKGKGIRYVGEIIKKKPGKQAAKAGE